MTAVLCGVSAFGVGAAEDAASADTGVSYDTELIRFRKEFDRYEVHDFGTINAGALEIVMNKNTNRFRPHPYVSPMPVNGPASVTVTTDRAPSNGVMTLRLRDVITKKDVEFRAPWRKVTRFETALDPSREYVFRELVITDPDHSKYFRFRVKSVTGKVLSGQAGACSVSVDTGSPLQVTDWPITSAPVVVISNRSDSVCSVSGGLKIEDYFGRAFTVPFEETVKGGDARRVPIPCGKGALDAKGVWNVTAELKGGDGKSAALKTSFGEWMDYHPFDAAKPAFDEWPIVRFD